MDHIDNGRYIRANGRYIQQYAAVHVWVFDSNSSHLLSTYLSNRGALFRVILFNPLIISSLQRYPETSLPSVEAR